MELVVDANVLIASFLRAAVTRELLLDERLTLHMPEYGLTETTRVLNRARLRKRLGHITQRQMQELLAQLTERIQLCAAVTYRPHVPEALQLTPDPADAPYLALALQRHIPLWSNDAPLKQQRIVAVYTTHELLDFLT